MPSSPYQHLAATLIKFLKNKGFVLPTDVKVGFKVTITGLTYTLTPVLLTSGNREAWVPKDSDNLSVSTYNVEYAAQLLVNELNSRIS